MKFVTEQIVASPREVVFAALTDFARFEREAASSGVELHRSDTLTRPGPGMRWRARFELRGRKHELMAELRRINHPSDILLSGKVGGLEGELAFDLAETAVNETRLMVEMNLRARSITAKLLLQSVKLARANVARRFRRRVNTFCRQTEKQLELV